MRDNNVWTIAVGVDVETSAEEARAASEESGVFASVGVHPDEALNGFDTEELESLASLRKVVAVGECGLDYFRLDPSDESKKAAQRNAFEYQIFLASRANKPLMIHCRPSAGTLDAYEDTIDIIRSAQSEIGESVRGNMHFFAGDEEMASRFLDLGFTLSFTGVITFADNYDDVIKYAPISMIMAETDSPFVAPVPHRGEVNEPSYVKEVVSRLAEIRGEDFEAVRRATVDNAFRVFGIENVLDDDRR